MEDAIATEAEWRREGLIGGPLTGADASREHPAPWQWHGDDREGWILRDGAKDESDPAGRLLVWEAQEAMWTAGPGVRELIRLAPELEALLRRAVELLGALGASGSPVAIESAALLATLDAARKATTG